MSAIGSEVLEAVGHAHECLRHLGHQLRTRPEVRSIGTGVDFFPATGPHSIPLSIYLEAVLHNDEPSVWMIDIGWHTEWVVSADVRYGTGVNIEYMMRFEERRANQPAGFVDLLRQVTIDLIGTVELIEFASLKPLPPEWPGAVQADD